jgi:hypothetical protein
VEMFAAFPKTSIGRAIPEVVRLARRTLNNTGFVEASRDGGCGLTRGGQ